MCYRNNFPQCIRQGQSGCAVTHLLAAILIIRELVKAFPPHFHKPNNQTEKIISRWKCGFHSLHLDTHLLWDMDKDVTAPVRWRNETMAFGAGKIFTHTSKHWALCCTSRPVWRERNIRGGMEEVSDSVLLSPDLETRYSDWQADKCLLLSSSVILWSVKDLQPYGSI